MTRGLRTGAVLAAAGAALLLLAAGRTWGTVLSDAPAPLPEVRTVLTGADLVPGLRALALAGLAGAAALLAARLRVLVGLLVVLVGAGAGALVLRVLQDPRAAVSGAGAVPPAFPEGDLVAPLWPLVALGASVLLVVAGLLVLARGGRGGGLAPRYDAPAARAVPAETSAWDALDRGLDPTDAPPTSVQRSTGQQEDAS